MLGISLVCGLASIAGLELFFRAARSTFRSYGTAIRATMDVDGTALASGTGVAVRATIPAASAGTVGTRVVARNVAIIVHEVRDNVPLAPAEQAKPGMRRYALDVSLTNTGAEEVSWYPSSGKVRTTENREFPATRPVGRVLEPELIAISLKKNETSRGWVFFDVPQDARVTQFVYNGYGDADVAVNLP